MAAGERERQTWAVVLAGGDGVRVREVIRRRFGLAQPKQFCAFGGSRSLLWQALDRAERVVPRERVVVVVCEAHRRWWEGELASLPRANVVVQPSNRGTATGVLAGLFNVLRRQRGPGSLLFLPSDHRVAEEDRLQVALKTAIDQADGGRLVLLGMPTSRIEAGYGWILPSARGNGTARPVDRFVEKPPPAEARRLLAEGALLNSFTFAVATETLVRLYARAAFDLLLSFAVAQNLRDPADPCGMGRLYEHLEVRDLSRDVLQRAPGELAVLRADNCGWADLGTPDRLERHLAGLRQAIPHAVGVDRDCSVSARP